MSLNWKWDQYGGICVIILLNGGNEFNIVASAGSAFNSLRSWKVIKI
ncbi:MAG: hypothetical protein ACTS5F_01510 [Candidatus Hodgkinia cicadicola]